MPFWHWKSAAIKQHFKCRYHNFINQVCKLQAGSHLTLTEVSFTTIACQMSCPIEMSASAFFYREPHSTLDYIQGWISLSLIHIPHVSSCHILLFSSSLNALAILVNMLWSASCLVTGVPAWKPGLHAYWDCGNLSHTADLAKVHNSSLPFQMSAFPSSTDQALHLMADSHSPLKTFLVIPSSRSPSVQTDWLLHKSCTTVTAP